MDLKSDQLLDVLSRLMNSPKNKKGQKTLQLQAKTIFDKVKLPKPKANGFDYVVFKPFYDAIASENGLDKLSIQIEKKENTIVFIDGVYQETLSDAPCSIEKLSENGLFSPLTNKIGLETLSSSNNPFVSFNYALDSDGIFIRFNKDQQVKQPITIVNFLTENKESNLSFRLHIHLAQNAKASIYMLHQPLKANIPFNLLTHIQVEKNAQLELIEKSQNNTLGLHQAFVEVKESGTFELKQINFTPKLFRGDYTVKLKEMFADAKLYGINITQDQNQTHFFAEVQHLEEETTSYQQIKNMSFDHSRTSFEGKIFVDAKAQKTKAYQLNQNLVLSEKAANFSKPNLQILADDVKASHGATFAKLDEEELFYLQSRGVSEKEAKTMLTKSFVFEFLDLIENQDLKAELDQEINLFLKRRLCEA